MKVFKTAVVSNHWKFKRVPWSVVVADGFKRHIAPVDTITVDIETGPASNRMTVTRVVAGGLLLGPVGMILGGMAKKDTSYNNLVIHFEDAVVRIPFKTKEYGQAQQFIEYVLSLQESR